jgi:hypothetical protein
VDSSRDDGSRGELATLSHASGLIRKLRHCRSIAGLKLLRSCDSIKVLFDTYLLYIRYIAVGSSSDRCCLTPPMRMARLRSSRSYQLSSFYRSVAIQDMPGDLLGQRIDDRLRMTGR